MQADPLLNAITDCLYRVAVKAFIINGDKVLLVKEDDDDWWSFPGGGVNHGENAAGALRRELLEELGVPAEEVSTDDKVVHTVIGAVVNGIPKANLFYRVYVPVSNIHPTDHVVESGWFRPDELAKLYMSPTTGKTAELISILKTLV